MSEEYEDEFESPEQSGVPPANAPSSKLEGVRTVDRRLGPLIIALVVITGAGLFWVMHSSTQSTAAVTDTHQPVLVSTAALRLPAPNPTPLAIAPSPLPTLRPQTPMPVAIAVPQEAPSQAQPNTPSPEEAFSEEERRRVLETRRASSRVLFDNDRDLAQQTDRDERDLAQGSQQVTGSAPMSSTPAAGVAGAAQGPHAQFIAQQDGAPGYMPTTAQYELRRGTIINANWSTTLDSTLPGGVLVARVSENVKDSITHSVVVLPAGTIITGSGDSQTQAGEARYLCVWDEVELPYPDSRKFYMGANPGGGRQGENGVDVSVDTHAGRDFGHAFLYSVLQAGVNLASRASTVVDLNSGNMGQVFQPTTRSAPTFHAYVGQPLTIIVAHDLPLDAFRDTR